MYFVFYKAMLGINVKKFKTLDEAKECINDLVEQGFRDVYLSQELP